MKEATTGKIGNVDLQSILMGDPKRKSAQFFRSLIASKNRVTTLGSLTTVLSGDPPSSMLWGDDM